MMTPERIPIWEGPLPSPLESSDTIIVLSDHQAPWQDYRLHGYACGALRELRPSAVIVNGDLVNFDEVSRYRRNWPEPLQRSVNAAYSILADYRDAAPEARILVLPGNHEQRLLKKLQDQLPELIGLTAADSSVALLGIPNLLSLASLNIGYIRSQYGEWPWARLDLSPDLVVLHGIFVRSNPGVTALATIQRLGKSAVVGHTHRQAVVSLGLSDGRQLVGVESGTMAQIAGGLGYDAAPNWTNGFTVIERYFDGDFAVRNVMYNGKRLLGL